MAVLRSESNTSKMKKKMVFSCTLHSYWMNLVQKWTSACIEFNKFGRNTIDFAENGHISNKKGMGKLIQSCLKDNVSSYLGKNGHQSTQNLKKNWSR